MLYWHLYAAPGSGSALASREPPAKVVLTIHNFDSSGECRQDEFAATGVDGAAFATIDKALDERTIGHNPERCETKRRSFFCFLFPIFFFLSQVSSSSFFFFLFPSSLSTQKKNENRIKTG